MQLEEYTKLKRRSTKLRLELIDKWSSWFYDHTDSFEGELGLQLAYLWPAIVKGKKIEAAESSPIVQILREYNVRDGDQIWDYIDIVNEQQPERS